MSCWVPDYRIERAALDEMAVCCNLCGLLKFVITRIVCNGQAARSPRGCPCSRSAAVHAMLCPWDGQLSSASTSQISSANWHVPVSISLLRHWTCLAHAMQALKQYSAHALKQLQSMTCSSNCCSRSSCHVADQPHTCPVEIPLRATGRTEIIYDFKRKRTSAVDEALSAAAS